MVWQVEAGMVCRGNDRKGPVWQAEFGMEWCAEFRCSMAGLD